MSEVTPNLDLYLSFTSHPSSQNFVSSIPLLDAALFSQTLSPSLPPFNNTTSLQQQLRFIQFSIAIFVKNYNLIMKIQSLVHKFMNHTMPPQPTQTSSMRPNPMTSFTDQELPKQLIKATNDKTKEMYTTRTNQETKESKKILKNNVFPPCTATKGKGFWDGNTSSFLLLLHTSGASYIILPPTML